MNDIYNPPPAAIPYNPPEATGPAWLISDLVCLALFCLLTGAVSAWAWQFEPSMAVLTMLGGTLVVLESWFTALGFLHRSPTKTTRERWTIFVAALLPWMAGLGGAAALMYGLFFVSDWIG